MRLALKGACDAVGLALTAVPGLLCGLEARVSGREDLFLFFGQTLALVPGFPGKCLRKCFYYWTLESGSLSCEIGFLTYFCGRRIRIGKKVYVGAGVMIGQASLGDGALIGNRVSILSGGHQHRFGADGRLTPFDRTAASRTRVGEETWVGEGAVLMADVGSHCVVAAGSVVSHPVPDGCVVGGNPARFVGRVTESAAVAPSPPAGRGEP